MVQTIHAPLRPNYRTQDSGAPMLNASGHKTPSIPRSFKHTHHAITIPRDIKMPEDIRKGLTQ